MVISGENPKLCTALKYRGHYISCEPSYLAQLADDQGYVIFRGCDHNSMMYFLECMYEVYDDEHLEAGEMGGQSLR
jgi:hypothetical protein